MEKETRRLAAIGLKPTPNRILVLRELAASDHPLSLGELETRLDTLDRSSIFRVLTLFLDHELVHSIEDGSGSLRYEVCAAPGKCTLSDRHVHFHCESCNRTFCFPATPVPAVELPPDFTAHSVNYVVKGECADCKKKNY